MRNFTINLLKFSNGHVHSVLRLKNLGTVLFHRAQGIQKLIDLLCI